MLLKMKWVNIVLEMKWVKDYTQVEVGIHVIWVKWVKILIGLEWIKFTWVEVGKDVT